jgi:hypothetical protein
MDEFSEPLKFRGSPVPNQVYFPSRRDYFAAAALEGVLARGAFGVGSHDNISWAIAHADALIKALEDKP